jgi:WhiB family redox-sensing transcriptional regulator
LPKYAEVDWEKAECKGIETDTFYWVEESRNKDAYAYIDAVRSICARCPIWSACLAYALEHEQYGVWGGMTSLERKSFAEPKKYPVQQRRATFSFEENGISIEEIRQVYEHSPDE